MNELEKNRLAQVIYSPEYLTQWRHIAWASKQFEAHDVAQQAAIYVFGDWADWFDMANVEHWNLLKDELFRFFMRSTDRAVKGLCDSITHLEMTQMHQHTLYCWGQKLRMHTNRCSNYLVLMTI